MVKHFTKNKDLIYLNSGSHSLVPDEVLVKIKEHLYLYEQNPTANMFGAWGELWKVQKLVAPHFGADPKNFFFRSNVTQPLNEFILGLELPAGSEILTSNQEYGAVFNICRFRAERDGLKLNTFAMPSRHEIREMTADDVAKRVIGAFTNKTKMLVVSEIFTGNGIVLPLEQIAREARARGIFTIVDGAHSPGYLKLDLEKSSVDFYAGNLHKWWMGSKGTGFGWARRESFKHLKPIQAGWVSYELREPFASFGDKDSQAIKTMMLGCQDFSPFFALPAVLNFWQEAGLEKIFARKHKLDQLVIAEADKALGFFRHASHDPSLSGPLHAYLLPEPFANMEFTFLIREILEKTHVQVAITAIDRELYLRLSPHIYNTEEEIVTGIGRLKKFFAR